MTLNRLSGLFVAMFGLVVYFWVIPGHTEVDESGWLKPATLPNICMIIIIMAGIVHFVFPKGKAEFDLIFSRRVGLFFVLGILGLILMHLIGFILAAPVIVLVIMILVGERRPLWLVSGIILLPATLWFCIDFLLNRPLP
jgi:putative tricarboxylic transport membrane protein